MYGKTTKFIPLQLCVNKPRNNFLFNRITLFILYAQTVLQLSIKPHLRFIPVAQIYYDFILKDVFATLIDFLLW